MESTDEFPSDIPPSEPAPDADPITASVAEVQSVSESAPEPSDGFASEPSAAAPEAPLPLSETPLEPTEAPEAEPAIGEAPAIEPPAAPAGIHLEVSALSDIGCVRTNNEDSLGYAEAQGLYIVCDGMGGMASGEVASATAVSTVMDVFAASAGSGAPISSRLLEAILAANQMVWQHGQTPEHKGMGTTLVAAAQDGEKLILGNVGDSRAYMVQDGHCVQLTVDHSYLNELIRNGTLTVENAHTADLNGMESVITRAIGAHPEVQPDFFSIDLHPGTTVLLATDGLSRYLLQDEIALVLINSPFESTCANLIQLAKDRGGHDNITCLLLRAV